MTDETISRCGWTGGDPLYNRYHDDEWGVPVHDDIQLFEMLALEAAQAGLSWITVLRRREAYRELFDHFDPRVVARYDEARIAELLQNPRIIRNQLKIRSVVSNANKFLKIQDEFGSFEAYIWRFVGGKPRHNCFQSMAEIPPRTAESDAMSKDLKKRGFSFVGSTICYAFMQSCGLVNDHVRGCFRFTCD